MNEAWRQRVRVLGPAVDEESRFDGLAAREHSLRGGGRHAPRVGAALLAVLICASVSGARPQSGAAGGNGRRNSGSAANSSTTADEADQGPRIPLQGGVHPLARAQFDRGAVADETPASHLLLVMSRPAERQAALEQFLRDAHTPGSASYHGWITPGQFGARFGAQPEDIQRVSEWLTAHGFAIEPVPSNGSFIRFSGNTGQLRSAFGAEIHTYVVNGQMHHANAHELSVPASLAASDRGAGSAERL